MKWEELKETAGGSAAYGGTLPSERWGGGEKRHHMIGGGWRTVNILRDNSTTGLNFSRGILTHVTTHIFYDSANRDLMGIAGGASIF